MTYTIAGCSTSTARVVTVPGRPVAAIAAQPDTVCAGVAAQVRYTGTASPAATYMWNWDGGTASPGTGQGPHLVSWPDTGTYTVQLLQVVEAACTSATPAAQTIVVIPAPAAEPLVDPAEGFAPLEVAFAVQGASPAATYTWNADGSSSTLLPGPAATYTYTMPGTYQATLEVVENGCTTTVARPIVVKATGLLIPNVFSPNGDGVNDILTIGGLNVAQSWNFVVYDRWGNQVYAASSPTLPSWNATVNGSPVPEGVYVYRLDFQMTGQKQVRTSGSITVVR